MNIEDEHWEYTKKVISIGMKIAVIAGLDKSEESEQDFASLIDCLAEIYKESFRHGYKHCKEDKK